jgi:predicted dinucleotide-binding enzyme
VPLVPVKVFRRAETSLGFSRARSKGGPQCRRQVVSSFQDVGAARPRAGGSLDCDGLVFGDDKASRDLAIAPAEAAGRGGINGGALVNSVAAKGAAAPIQLL